MSEQAIHRPTTARIMINGWSRPQVVAIKEQAIANDMSVSEYLRVTLISALGLPPLEGQQYRRGARVANNGS